MSIRPAARYSYRPTPRKLSGLTALAQCAISAPKAVLRANNTAWSWPTHGARYPLRDGDSGIKRTIEYMEALVLGNEGAANLEVRRTAIDITRNVASRNYIGEIDAIQQWVLQNIKFRGEYKETIQTPLVTLKLRAGDCDDHAQLVAALLMSIGHKTRFKTVAADRQAPNDFSHVFTEVQNPRTQEWIPIETTVAGVRAGWAPPNIYRAQAWRTMGPMQGLGNYINNTPPVVVTPPADTGMSGWCWLLILGGTAWWYLRGRKK
ncbi:MAG TPA: transglutaminase-like domain-containing protein [Terriglobales bacterium]|nr:transglutaminase-like domain-containing protein [Terriglobales bacterium]